jgi:hypothetical protein
MGVGKTLNRKIWFPALVLVATLVGLNAATAKADPLLFSNLTVLQNNSSVDLFTNSGVTLVGPSITFTVDVSGTLPAGGTDTLQITYIEVGSPPVIQTFAIPFGQFPPPLTFLFSVVSPGANAQGVAATLKIDLLNSSPDFVIPIGPGQGQQVNSYTYSFNVAQPVPEPLTLTTLSTSLFSLAALRRRRRN